MPIYEYECRSCGHQLEVFQKITEDDLKKCPNCGKDALGKLISAANFQLKGTGWYVTDIRDKGKKKPPDDKAETQTTKDTKETKETKTTDTKSKDTSSDSGASST